MNKSLPLLPDLKTIIERLPVIFPEGTENRNYVIREMSAKSIFVMFYVGAIEKSNRWIRPDQVTKMTDNQANKIKETDRLSWYQDSLVSGKMKNIKGRWYLANTREPIRDETLRAGLVNLGAVIERKGLPTTSPNPRYALQKDFANLFDESLTYNQILNLIDKWQEKYLSSSALTRIRLVRRGALSAKIKSPVTVNFPNGEVRRLAPGPSSILIKQVVEVFSKRYLLEPAFIFLSESRDKVVTQDEELAQTLGLQIQPERNLPDIVMADLGPEQPLLIFVEVVITNGAITNLRKDSLLKLATGAGFSVNQIGLVTAFRDRDETTFRRLSSNIAWGSFVWFASEPECLMVLPDKEKLRGLKISDYL